LIKHLKDAKSSLLFILLLGGTNYNCAQIDSLNTLQLISIIDKFGIDSLNKVDKSCGENSLIVFVHTPEGLKPIVREVMKKNKEEVGENRFRHILWHLNGRTND
jgi:hypothetical protein